jgi:hypothetical protein
VVEPQLPPCGIYRTVREVAEVPAGRLVYFHNHGDPGPGIYTPHEWRGNRARFHERGHTLSPADVTALEPLASEGFYRVLVAFTCCKRECRRFEPDAFVQLGYDGAATPILFTPELGDVGLTLPERGIAIDPDRVAKLAPLQVATASATPTTRTAGDRVLH